MPLFEEALAAGLIPAVRADGEGGVADAGGAVAALGEEFDKGGLLAQRVRADLQKFNPVERAGADIASRAWRRSLYDELLGGR